MKRQIRIWATRALSLAVVVFAVNQWGAPVYKQYFTPKKKTVFMPTAKVKQGPFVVSFHEIGTLEAVNSTTVISEVGGKIISLVPEGRVVRPGDALAELDTTELERQVRDRELKYQNTLADIARAESEFDILRAQNQTEMDKAEAQYNFDLVERDRAKEELERQERLAKEELVPRSARDKAAFDVRSKELSLKKSEMDQDLKKTEISKKEEQRKADIRKAEFAANIAKSDLEEVRRWVEKAVITAPAPGMVVMHSFRTSEGRRKFIAGDNVNPRQSICELPDLSSMQVRVKVGEADAPKLRLELPVLIRLEAVPNKTFRGIVKEIASLATEADVWGGDTPGRKNFEVLIAVKESDPKTLKPGMTADAEFICDSAKDALFVPIESVVEREGKTWVFVKNGQSYERKQVKLGKQNDNFVVITHGLKKGEVVSLRDPTKSLEQQEPRSAPTGSKEKNEPKKAAPIPGAEKG